MATSPDFLRLASNATQPLADTALDSLRDAVLVVDARHRQLPVVLANAAARHNLRGEIDAADLIDWPMARLLDDASGAKIKVMLDAASESLTPISRVVTWRFARGNHPAMTEIKPLLTDPGQRLMMLTFAPPGARADLATAIDQLPRDLLILDTELKVTYANAGAMRSAASVPGGVLGCSALMLTPTLVLKPEVFANALDGRPFHDDALAYIEDSRPTRWFEIDVQPLEGSRGIEGLGGAVERSDRASGQRPRAEQQ